MRSCSTPIDNAAIDNARFRGIVGSLGRTVSVTRQGIISVSDTLRHPLAPTFPALPFPPAPFHHLKCTCYCPWRRRFQGCMARELSLHWNCFLNLRVLRWSQVALCTCTSSSFPHSHHVVLVFCLTHDVDDTRLSCSQYSHAKEAY